MERDWLKKKRLEKNISQEKVAKMCEITQEYYSLLEKGLRQPAVKVAKKLGRVLDFNWEEFYKEEQNP